MRPSITKRPSKAKHEERLTGKLRPLPEWQTERANRLHRQFKRVEVALQAGKSVSDALRQFEWYWRGEHYRTDARRRVRFSLSTLRRLFYRWRKGGRLPAALALNFARLQPYVSAPVMVRLVNICTSRRWPSLLAAWNASGLERQPITYGQAVRYFSAAHFRELQTQLATIESAPRELKRLVNHHTQHLRRRLPARIRRQRKARRGTAKTVRQTHFPNRSKTRFARFPPVGLAASPSDALAPGLKPI